MSNAPSIQVDSSFTGGGAQADVARSENTIHISEAVSLTHKNHYIRFGANIPQISRRAVDDRTNRLGTFGFNSLADYAKPIPTPYVFTSQQGPGRGLYWINEIGGFFQDQIRLTSQMALTLGLRYQLKLHLRHEELRTAGFDCIFAPPEDLTAGGLRYLFRSDRRRLSRHVQTPQRNCAPLLPGPQSRVPKSASVRQLSLRVAVRYRAHCSASTYSINNPVQH